MAKRIVVPGGMWKVARTAYDAASAGYGPHACVEASLLWLDESLERMLSSDPVSNYDSAIGDVRRIFVVYEPEVPEEIIDLLRGREDDDLILEAYKRGLNSKEKA